MAVVKNKCTNTQNFLERIKSVTFYDDNIQDRVEQIEEETEKDSSTD